LLFRREFRDVFLFGTVYVLSAGLLLSILYACGELPFFLKNVVQGISNGISGGWFSMVILKYFYQNFGLVFLLLFIILVFTLSKESRLIFRFTRFLLVLLFVLVNIVALKNGSNPGYFTEWWSLLIIVSVFYLEKISRLDSAGNLKIVDAITRFVFIMKMALLAFPVYRITVGHSFAEAYDGYKREKVLAEKMRDLPDQPKKNLVFLNYYTPGSFMSCLLFRQVVMPQMDIVILASYPDKGYDYADFIARIKNGDFTYMVMRETGPQKVFFDIPLDFYQLKETLNGYNIYKYQR
jgi:hypothetical protein